MMSKNNWAEIFADCGTSWKHDGHPLRPYALLTSGRISNEFFDLSFALARPQIIDKAAIELAEKLSKKLRHVYGGKLPPLVICGQMKGSVTIASHIASHLNAGYIFTNQVGEGEDKQMLLDERFEGLHPADALVVMAEDVTTTGGTTQLSWAGIKKSGFTNISPSVLTVVDRSGKASKNYMDLIECYTPPTVQSWVRGENPYTEGGAELVEPVRPKTKAGRLAMRMQYTET